MARLSGFLKSGWKLRQWKARVRRSFGAWEAILLGFLLIGILALGGVMYQQRLFEDWQTQTAALPAKNPVKVSALPLDSDRQRLLAFEQHLLPHQDIPFALQDMLRLAEEEGLTIRHAEYRAQAEPRGGFMRYRINLPVQGKSETVNRYIYEALLAQKNLALESVQLKRETLESQNLEARIQWVLLTRLPLTGIGLETP
jgi:uncharacterized iron-regulated membrane protein